jgi:hypothetical protein
MPTKFTVVFDCADPDRLAHFWAEALGYSIEPPPEGFATWAAYWRSRGLAESELTEGDDAVFDPSGKGSPIYFQKIEEGKVVKNRLHLDLHESGGAEVPLAIRQVRVDAAVERLTRLGATRLGVLSDWPGVDHYAVAMLDPEGNEFDVN